jgi:hypothetical protein
MRRVDGQASRVAQAATIALGTVAWFKGVAMVHVRRTLLVFTGVIATRKSDLPKEHQKKQFNV